MTNSVVIIGRLARDPELRKTSNDLSICKMTVAVESGFGDKQRTDFVPVTAWGKTAEFCDRFMRKGRLVSVEGSIQTGSYTKQDGTKVYTMEVNASVVSALDYPKDNNNNTKSEPKPDFTKLEEEIPF